MSPLICLALCTTEYIITIPSFMLLISRRVDKFLIHNMTHTTKWFILKILGSIFFLVPVPGCTLMYQLREQAFQAFHTAH